MKELKGPMTQHAVLVSEYYPSIICKACTMLMKTLHCSTLGVTMFQRFFTCCKGWASSAEHCFVGQQAQGHPLEAASEEPQGVM